MISEAELLKLMADLESDRVERTISTNDTTKFREAICAFSNDFPNHRLPGYLLIGVGDKTGKACGLKADDASLRSPRFWRPQRWLPSTPTALGVVRSQLKGCARNAASYSVRNCRQSRFNMQPSS